MANKKDSEKILHGNNARIDPKKQVSSLYQSNMVTTSDKKNHETPLSTDENVAYARKFVETNKK